jgi:hypothetical protein
MLMRRVCFCSIGHGFCEPCLEEHFAHHGQSSNLSCPTCRKPVRRKEAFPLFLAPAQSSTGSHGISHPTAEAAHTRSIRELKEVKAAHANCSGRFIGLQHEIDTLRRDDAHHHQTILHLRDRCELLEGRLAKEADNSARAREESNRMKEDVTKLQVENHKTSRALEQSLKDVQVQLDRVKLFQGYIEQYKHKVVTLITVPSISKLTTASVILRRRKERRSKMPTTTYYYPGRRMTR